MEFVLISHWEECFSSHLVLLQLWNYSEFQCAELLNFIALDCWTVVPFMILKLLPSFSVYFCYEFWYDILRLSRILRLTLGFKGLRHVADIRPSPLPRKSRKKLFALRMFMKSVMLRLTFRFIQFLPSELIKQISFYLCFRGKGHYIWFLFENSICGVTRRRGIFLGSDLYSELESTLTCSQLNLACVLIFGKNFSCSKTKLPIFWSHFSRISNIYLTETL